MQNIIERYLYAVVKNLKESQKESVIKELDSRIHEMLKVKTNGKEPTKEDVYAVLEELGKPYDLAKKYMDSEKGMLLKHEYFKVYKGVTLTTLPIVIVICILGAYTSGVVMHEHWLKVIAICLESAFIGFCFYFTVITLIFIILQYLNVSIGSENICSLPQVPKTIKKHSNTISYVALGIMFLLGITIFVKSSLIFAAVVDMKRISIFDEIILNEYKYLIVCILIVTIIRESYNMLTNGIGIKSYVIISVLDLMEISMLFVLFLRPRIISSEFIGIFQSKFPDKQIIVNFFANFNYWIVGIFLLTVLLRNISDFNKRLRNGVPQNNKLYL